RRPPRLGGLLPGPLRADRRPRRGGGQVGRHGRAPGGRLRLGLRPGVRRRRPGRRRLVLRRARPPPGRPGLRRGRAVVPRLLRAVPGREPRLQRQGRPHGTGRADGRARPRPDLRAAHGLPVGAGAPDRPHGRPAVPPGVAPGHAGLGAFRPAELVGHRPGGPIRRVASRRLAPGQPAPGGAVPPGQLAAVGPPAGGGGGPALVVVVRPPAPVPRPGLEGPAPDPGRGAPLPSLRRLRVGGLPPPRQDLLALDGDCFGVEGRDLVDKALAEGKGVVIGTPHLGNWDLGAAWFAAHGYRPTTVVEPIEPPALFEWFCSYRRALGMGIVPLGPDAGTILLKKLREGLMVGLV